MNPMPRESQALSENGRPELSVCMIVKDEAGNLERCLASVAAVASEIIVVDTGSTDGSQKIAQGFGAKVYEHPWQDDFSIHRNQSLSYACGDWILQIDADETLAEESTIRLVDLLASAPADILGYWVRLENLDRHGRRNAVFYYPRLFRNHAGVVYQSTVHNQVVIPGRLAHSDVILRHHGYDLSADRLEQKVSRTEALLLARLEKDPEDVSALCNLTHTYSMARRFEKTVETGERAVALLQRNGTQIVAHLGVFYPLVTSAIALGHYERALQLCEMGLSRFAGYVDLHYQRTRIYAKTHRYGAVLASGDAYHRAREQAIENPVSMATLTFYTLDLAFRVDYWQGLASLATGDWQRADRHLQRAVASAELTVDTARELLWNLQHVPANQLSRRWTEACLSRYPQLRKEG